MSTDNRQRQSCTRALAHALIRVSHAQPTDNVTIAGAGHLELLVELMRDGYGHALCRSVDHGPHMARPPADILVAPNVRDESDLCNILQRLGSDLRPRGLIVFSCAQSDTFGDRNLRRVLIERGFTAVERIAGEGNVGTLWCAHKRAASLRHAA